MADTNGTKVSPAEKVQKNAERPKITELNLDNCKKENILKIVEKHPDVEMLSLINTNLTSLKGFPKLEKLRKLRLSDNRIVDGLNYLVNCPKLENLDLSGNKIKEIEVLEALQEFKQLTTLYLFNNEVSNIDNYREKVFKMLPSLKYVDGMDANNVEAPSDDEDDINGNDSDEDGSEDDLEEYDEDDEEGGEEEDDMSLAEIYNEDLEEDNSDWEEDEVGDDDDDDIESDDENETAAAAATAEKGDKKAAESDEPTNKKRKTAE